MSPSVVEALGLAYSSGAMTIAQVAARLGISIPDAIAELEHRGHRRSIQTIRLGDGDRDAICARLHADRIRRNGIPSQDFSRVERNVIASLRLAGISIRALGSGTE